MSILMIGLVSAAAATVQMHDLRRTNRERIVAQNAVRSIGERIHARSYALSEHADTWAAELLAVFGPGGTHGDTFSVPFLTPLDGAGNPNGSITLVTDERLTDADLGFDLGMPRDLNGDGDAADGDVSGDARLLPVIVTLEWRGKNGPTRIDHAFYVMGY